MVPSRPVRKEVPVEELFASGRRNGLRELPPADPPSSTTIPHHPEKCGEHNGHAYDVRDTRSSTTQISRKSKGGSPRISGNWVSWRRSGSFLIVAISATIAPGSSASSGRDTREPCLPLHRTIPVVALPSHTLGGSECRRRWQSSELHHPVEPGTWWSGRWGLPQH